MAGLKGITVNTAPEAEPHIYAEDDAAIFQAMFGEDGVSSIGQACKATVLSNNKVRIADGVLCVGGHFARIPYGEYVDCEIANGQSGKNRNDIIVAKLVTTGSGGIDTMTCEVKQGTANTTATDPTLTQNDIYKGGKIRELPLYRVKLEGLNITAVEQLFTVNPTNKDLSNKLTELNGNMNGIKYKRYAVTKNFAKGTNDAITIDIPWSKIVSIQGTLRYGANLHALPTSPVGGSGTYNEGMLAQLVITSSNVIQLWVTTAWISTTLTVVVGYTD